MSKFDASYNKILSEIAPAVAAVARPVVGAALGMAAKKLAGTKEENITNPAQVQQNQSTNQQQPQQNNQPPANPQQVLKDLSANLAKINNSTEIEKMLNTPETKKALAAILTAK